MRRILINFTAIASMLLCVSGCVAAALGGAGAVGAAVVQEKTVGTAIDDASTSNGIKTRLLRESRPRFKEVDVEVSEGLVLLSGRVSSPEDRLFAEHTAWTIGTTLDVANEIKIERPGGFMANLSDSVITSRVRASLAKSKTVRSVNFNIETYNGIVYLMGVARSQKELQHAAEKASYIGGVKEVVSYVRLAENQTAQAAPVSQSYIQPTPQTQPQYPAPLQPQGQPIGQPNYQSASGDQSGSSELAGGGIY